MTATALPTTGESLLVAPNTATATDSLGGELMTDAQLLASSLHSQTCKNHGYNGTCTWNLEAVDQEFDEWEGHAHVPFLETANEMLKLTDAETALKMVALALKNRPVR